MTSVFREPSPVDDLDVVTIEEAPRLCALYRTREPELPAHEQPPEGVAGWVLAWPDGSALTLVTEGGRRQIITAPLASVQKFWTGVLAADLVAVNRAAA
ncbi:hypothetical protein [Plantactinospora sp. CA-290183]|uniref:hypothetical protein n=1 Tax=Plantactinospora sp. CA-290183 TaxID=3240006 RepID=UPI003D925BE0